jgi:hypothetical protein
VDASNLKAGYRLLNDDDRWATVTGLTVENAPLTAYNMKVEDYTPTSSLAASMPIRCGCIIIVGGVVTQATYLADLYKMPLE